MASRKPFMEAPRDVTLREQVAVRLTTEQLERIDAVADAHGRGRGYVVRTLLDAPLRKAARDVGGLS